MAVYCCIKQPKIETLSPEAYQDLQQAITASSLSQDHKNLVIGVLDLCLWLQQKLTFSKISIHTLKKVFAIQTEKRHRPQPEADPDIASTTEAANDEGVPPVNADDTAKDDQQPSKIKGHGRIAADAYTAAETIALNHPDYTAGDPCPLHCGGRLYQLKTPGVFIRIEGGQLFEAYRYEQQRLRCAICGEVFKASLPPGIVDKYDERSKAMIAVLKYQLGLPLYRLAQWQRQTGVPLPDTTQWERCVEVYQAILPIYHLLVYYLAQSSCIYQDDTWARILSVKTQKEHDPQRPDRKGTYTTALVGDYSNHPLYIFTTSLNHAGENLSKVLVQRDESLPPVMQACDALKSNQVDDAITTLVCHCLVHGRRKFIDLESYYPDQASMVLDTISAVYAHEDKCQQANLSPKARLAYHQEHSGPLMANLKAWMEQQIVERKAEPNSPLGKSYRYWLKHWQTLTRFLTYVGVPLDTNRVERALKLAIRVRNNSLFYKTLNGGHVGSVLMSVIHTALHNGINPIDYLTDLQIHAQDVKQSPKQWLPWCYQETLNSMNNPQEDLAA
ncbi:IS66 family transposase [Zooshikella ganghwensis]|uniref:IS66 family transposase n=1 Tax=Zooshikella ganghwensis TaxID=202772 RepID=A0A4P9VRT2_9GAMM|nr:IS66 family transposase [Zooshikella ganghwensis]